jgi:hypothetical protein
LRQYRRNSKQILLDIQNLGKLGVVKMRVPVRHGFCTMPCHRLNLAGAHIRHPQSRVKELNTAENSSNGIFYS